MALTKIENATDVSHKRQKIEALVKRCRELLEPEDDPIHPPEENDAALAIRLDQLTSDLRAKRIDWRQTIEDFDHIVRRSRGKIFSIGGGNFRCSSPELDKAVQRFKKVFSKQKRV